LIDTGKYKKNGLFGKNYLFFVIPLIPAKATNNKPIAKSGSVSNVPGSPVYENTNAATANARAIAYNIDTIVFFVSISSPFRKHCIFDIKNFGSFRIKKYFTFGYLFLKTKN
jgi:hypothetical protein